MPDRTLIVMVKEPRAGRVKTRLGKDIGMVPAAWWYRQHVRRLLRNLNDPRWQIVLGVAPDRTAYTARFFPPHLPRMPQGPGGLGARMARLIRRQLPGKVILIGSDIPGITRSDIARAFAVLGPSDMVIGPAEDGGFWLVGARAPHILPHRAFDGVRWSGPHALGDTLKGLRALSVGEANTLRDVDTARDLPG